MVTVHGIEGDRIEAILDGLFGDGLRAVWTVAADGGREHLHVRSDVAARYSEEESREIGRELMLQLWERDYHEDLFDVGDVRYASYHFEAATLVMLYLGDEEGMVVSVDAGAAVDAEEVADAVRSVVTE